MRRAGETRLVALLRELVEMESPSGSPGAHAVSARIAAELEGLGAEAKVLEGGHLQAKLPGQGDPLLLSGHVDTVWPEGTLATMPFRVEGSRAFGPGVYDMKACLVVMLEAIRVAGEGRRALRVFLTADEEKGSVTGREPLEEAAKGVAAAFVVEPPSPTGNLKTARKGLGRFTLTIKGRAAHAGTHPGEGVSAIEELAHQIQAVHAIADEERGCTVNVGVVEGGTSTNVIPPDAHARIDVRVSYGEDRERVERALAELRPVNPNARLELGGGWTRPPLERSEGAAKLFARARAVGLEEGLDLAEISSGGGSDGNLIGALGVPVLDGLGAEGGGAHSADEYVELESIPVRAKLLSNLLRDPGVE
jgi:glutamate carboxypeptidase